MPKSLLLLVLLSICICCDRVEGQSNGQVANKPDALDVDIKPLKAVQQVPVATFDLSGEMDRRSKGGPLLPRRTLNHSALVDSYWDIVGLLADGADPNSKSESGTPLLFHAIDYSAIEVRDIIGRWEVEATNRSMRKQPIPPRPKMIPRKLEALLRSGADPHLCNAKGQSPLHYAIQKNQTEAIALLLEYGADPNQADSSGITALDFATQRMGDSPATTLMKEDRGEAQIGKKIAPPATIRTPDLQLGNTNFRPAAGGQAITYSADGNQIVSGQTEHVLRVFDANTGARISAINTRFDYRSNNYIWSLTAIPRSRIVMASGSIGDPLRFWNIDSGTEVMRLKCNCNCASASPDGKFLFTGDYLCQIDAVDPLQLATTAKGLRGTNEQKIQVRSSFFTPDSRYLVFADHKHVRAWDLESDQVVPIKNLDAKTFKSITWGDLAQAVKIDSTYRLDELIAIAGNQVGILSGDPKVLWKSQPLVSELAKQKSYRAVAISPNGHHVAALGQASRIDIFDLQNQGKRIAYDGHTDRLLAIAASSDGKWIASGGLDRQVILWDQESGKVVRTLPINAVVQSLCFSSDGSKLAIGDGGSGIHLHNVLSGATSKWKSKGKVTGLAFDDARKALIVLGDNLELRDLSSGKVLSSVAAGTARFGKVAYSQKDLILGCSISQAGEVTHRNAWAIDGTKLVPANNTFGESQDEDPLHSAADAVAISRAGDLAVTSAPGSGLRLWNLAKRETIGDKNGIFQGGMSRVNDIDFSFDGKYIAAGYSDGTVRVWDVATARQLLICDADVNSIADIAFQKDGRLVTANGDGTVHVWDVAKHLTAVRAFGL